MVILTGLGSLMLLLLAYDVFLVAFHPQGRGGPINRRVSLAIWSVARRVGRDPDGSPRGALLAFGGPTIVIAAIATWVFLLVAGFTLIYYPSIETFLVSPGSLRSPWTEALYYSAYTASTIGFGDVIADTEVMRMVTILEGFGGFALVSVSITYFLAVYRELIAMQSLASDIASLVEPGVDELLSFTREQGCETLARWCEQLSTPLSQVLIAHFQYPVLYYFRPAQDSRSLPAQLGALLRMRRAIEAAKSSEAIATLARHPSYRALQTSVDRYLLEVDRLFVPDADQSTTEGTGDDVHRAHGRLMKYMVY